MGSRPPNDLDIILINTEQTYPRLQSSWQKDVLAREPREGWEGNKQDFLGKEIESINLNLKTSWQTVANNGDISPFWQRKSISARKTFSMEMLTTNLGWKELLQLKRNQEPIMIWGENAMNLKSLLYFSLLTCKMSFSFCSSFYQKHQHVKYHRIIETKSINLSSKVRKKITVIVLKKIVSYMIFSLQWFIFPDQLTL